MTGQTAVGAWSIETVTKTSEEAPPFKAGEESRGITGFLIDYVIDFFYSKDMKLTLQTQLFPGRDHSIRLKATVERFNEAANWLAEKTFGSKAVNKIELQKRRYNVIRQRFGLSAQMTVRCIAPVGEACERDKTKRTHFHKHAMIASNQRMMSFKGIDRVSLLAVDGRVVFPVVMGKYQTEEFTNAKGQADLILRKDGKWFLLVIVDVPDAAPIPVTDFLGVDLGIANVAADSDGDSDSDSGKSVEAVRRKHNLQRKRLQKKTKPVAGKGARFRKHENHMISKALVGKAKDAGRGIAVEELKGIRERLPVWGRDARNKLSGWSFAQLVAFRSYKAALAGAPLVKIDPRNTSGTRAECGYCDKTNGTCQAKFLCVSCGHHAHADQNAARNIRALAASKTAMELVGPRV